MKKDWQTYEPKDLSLGVFHSLMLAAVGPRPIAFVSSVNTEGQPNLAPFSFFNAFGSNPATLVFSPARRGKDNTTKHTLHNVEATGECVINVVNYSMVEQASLASTDFPEDVNEFIKAGFTEVPSQFVKPPRVGESPAAFECKVLDIIKMGTEGGAGNLVICEILALHYDSTVMTADGKVDQFKMDLVGRMGYEYYCRAFEPSIFEVPKPRTKNIIGFDGLPAEIRASEFLTGNELSRLANCLEIPPVETIFELQKQIESTQPNEGFWLSEARNCLKANHTDLAWAYLFKAYPTLGN